MHLDFDASRRNLLLRTLAAAGAVTTPYLLTACGNSRQSGVRVAAASACRDIGPLPENRCSSLADIGPLQAADENGIRLPAGFSSRVIAARGQAVGPSGYIWPSEPDGAATYPTADGGWILVVNSEMANGAGGVSAVRFNAAGDIVDAYRICADTTRNCAGGTTPWNTWLTCEENGDAGFVWETDPWGCEQQVRKPLLGAFNHEAVAVDPVNRVLYLTEDSPSGLFYRFVPSASDWPAGASRAALEDGRLEAFVADSSDLTVPTTGSWVEITDPDLSASGVPTRTQGQNAGATSFNGGEGIWYHEGLVYFATKGDNKVWLWDCVNETVQEVYDGNGILTGSDNVTITCQGDVLIAEDGGNMELILLLPDGTLKPLLQFEGHDASEVTGPCLSPDGKRLYVNSQRGAGVLPLQLDASGGVTYEILLPA